MDTHKEFVPTHDQTDKIRILVSGSPRNGTSLMMDCLRLACGEDSIIGNKFPRDLEADLIQGDNESDKRFGLRKFVKDLTTSEKAIEDSKFSKDMNPNGFWEDPRFSVRGVGYSPLLPDFSGKVLKVVSQGLFSTPPDRIEKIIYMIRHPRAVAKSMERIRRMPFIDAKQEAELEVHTPEMFIEVTFRAAAWFVRNPNVDHLIVEFEKLIENPDDELARISEFTGVDLSESPIEKRLQRSSDPKDRKDHYLFEYAIAMFEMMRRGEYKEVVDYYLLNQVQINRHKAKIPCARSKRVFAYDHCAICRSGHSETIYNLIDQAEDRRIDWEDEPCVFECGGDPTLSDDEILSIDESIENNHWRDHAEV